jgi:hypothetical protein
MDKSTTIFKMAKTGLLKDNECEVKVIEPIGLSPCMIIVDLEFEKSQDTCSLDVMGRNFDISDTNWPPSEYR